MFTIILFAVAGAATAFLTTRDMFFLGVNTALGGALGLAAGSLAWIVLGVVNISPENFERQETTREIISLQSNTSLSGEFFLGTGSVQGEKVYYYYVRTDRGAISKRVDADRTYVKEKSGTPKITRIRYEQKNPSNWYFVIPPKDTLEEYNQIQVPEGSIKREFNPN
jgi:hypothetical protein